MGVRICSNGTSKSMVCITNRNKYNIIGKVWDKRQTDSLRCSAHFCTLVTFQRKTHFVFHRRNGVAELSHSEWKLGGPFQLPPKKSPTSFPGSSHLYVMALSLCVRFLLCCVIMVVLWTYNNAIWLQKILVNAAKFVVMGYGTNSKCTAPSYWTPTMDKPCIGVNVCQSSIVPPWAQQLQLDCRLWSRNWARNAGT